MADIHGVKAVHIFGGIDGFEDALGVDLRGQRKLNEDAVDGVVFVQAVDEAKTAPLPTEADLLTDVYVRY